MASTGIVRRIDELGRIVIPKEIRKTLRIQEGENIEISLDNRENIILKKYSVMKNLNDFAQNLTEAIYNFLKKDIMVSDTDTIIAVSGPLKKTYFNQKLSLSFLENVKMEQYSTSIEIIEGDVIDSSYIIQPIYMNGDTVGFIFLFGDDITELDKNIIKIASSFLSKYLED